MPRPHGAAGTPYLGCSVITCDSLTDNANQLQTLGAAFSAAGDLLVYGCEVAQGVTGKAFIASLARYTGAEVAASAGLTGSGTPNGDWNLEAATGAIEVPAIAAAMFTGVLAPTIDLSTIPAGTGGFVIYGQDAGDGSGVSVASAGDINGDGFDDLIIGTRGSDAASNIKNYAGDSHLNFGRDFSGGVTHSGTTGADIVIVGQGNDAIIGIGGADVMRGSEWNDLLTIASLNFRDIDGGSGSDTLALAGGGLTLNLSDIGNSKLSGIEAIDLDGGGNDALVLNALALLNLSDSSNTLPVEATPGARCCCRRAAPGGHKAPLWGSYSFYTQGQAVLQVATAMAVPQE